MMSKSCKNLILFALALLLSFSLLGASFSNSSAQETPGVSDAVGTEMGGGGGAVWTAKDVNVLLFAGDYWNPKIEKIVKDARKALPPKGPRLHVRTMDQHSCEWVRAQSFSQPTITFCDEDAWYAGSTGAIQDHHTFLHDRVSVRLVQQGRLHDDINTACHEMMHALAYVTDNYNYPHPDSCVQGDIETFGKWDIKYLAIAYQKHDTKSDKKRAEKRENRKHHGRRGGKHGGHH